MMQTLLIILYWFTLSVLVGLFAPANPFAFIVMFACYCRAGYLLGPLWDQLIHFLMSKMLDLLRIVDDSLPN